MVLTNLPPLGRAGRHALPSWGERDLIHPVVLAWASLCADPVLGRALWKGPGCSLPPRLAPCCPGMGKDPLLDPATLIGILCDRGISHST